MDGSDVKDEGTLKMNANELADVFNTYDEPHDWGTQAATMLRQQQAEIEYWKEKFNKAMELQEK